MPPAAPQPGFTTLNPFSASMLGLFLFGEAAALAVAIAGSSALSHSHVIVSEHVTSPAPPAGYPQHSHRERARR